MKSIILLISFFTATIQTLDVDTIRNAYKGTAQDDSKAEAFYNSLMRVSENDKVELVGYKAAAIALKSKQGKTLKDKKNGFIEGVTLLENTIKKEPNNIELRFIRLTIQENTPKLLKYKADIESDKQFILKQYQSIASRSLKNYLKDYILQSKGFTDKEKAVILTE